jgi:hypothetical protein
MFKSERWPFGLFLFAACGFHLDKILLGPFALVRIHDTFDYPVGTAITMGRYFQEFGHYFWYPNANGGIPTYSYHSAPYHPINLLFSTFPPWLVYHALTIILMFVAGFGMYFFLRKITEIRITLALFGSLVFMLGTQTHENSIGLGLGFLYSFPLFFVCVFQIAKGVDKRQKIGCIVVACCLLIFSYPVLTLPFYSVFHVLAIYCFLNDKNCRTRMLISAVLIWTGYMLIHAPVIIGLFDYIPFIQRTYPEPSTFAAFFSGLVERVNYWVFKIASDAALAVLLFAVLPLVFVSSRLRRASIPAVLVLLIGCIFLEPLPKILSYSLLRYADLNHFLWIVFPAVVIFSIVGIDEMNKKNLPAEVVLACFSFGWIVLFLNPPDWVWHDVKFSLIFFSNLVVSIGGLLFVTDKASDSELSRYRRLGLIILIAFVVLEISNWSSGERSWLQQIYENPWNQLEDEYYIKLLGRTFVLVMSGLILLGSGSNLKLFFKTNATKK